jgi:hypothetical protein
VCDIASLPRYSRRFAHFPPNLLKSLARAFENLASIPLEFIEYKGLMEMAEPRVSVTASRKAFLAGLSVWGKLPEATSSQESSAIVAI